MFAAFAALIIGRQVLASFGTRMMPSTLRVMKFFTCSSWRFASWSATASSILKPRFAHSLLMASKPATQYSVCNVSNATPMVSGFSPPAAQVSGLFAAASKSERNEISKQWSNDFHSVVQVKKGFRYSRLCAAQAASLRSFLQVGSGGVQSSRIAVSARSKERVVSAVRHIEKAAARRAAGDGESPSGAARARCENP